MTSAAILVLLVGELSAPLKPALERALPVAFVDQPTEVALGTQAPPGRTVAWVTVKPDEVELLLHTARVPGDLRRVLRFSPADAEAERARTIAFGLALLVKERALAMDQTAPDAGQPTADAGEPTPVVAPLADWSASVRGVLSVDPIAGAPGGGATLSAHRVVARPGPLALDVGLGVGLSGDGLLRNAAPLIPAAWASARLAVGAQRLVPRLELGVGAQWLVISRDGALVSVTTQPLFRAALELEVHLVGPHRVVVGASTHATTSSVEVPPPTNGNPNGNPNGGNGNGNVTTRGPLWVRAELGYVVAW